MIVLHLAGVFLLVLINAFFAAAEFSLVAVRASRVHQLVEEGDARARIVESLLADLNRVVSGVQVGITIVSLLLGYVGEITLSNIISPLVADIPSPWAAVVAHSVALVIAFALLTGLEVVLGELVPKTLSLASAERVALIIARPFKWFLHTFRWAIDALDFIAAKFVRLLGVTSPPSHTLVRSIEELQVLVQQAREGGLISAGEVKFIQSAMELSQIQVREVMVPRPDVHALPVTATLEETMSIIGITQRSRIPVYEGSLDHILGFVHIKDLIWVLLDRARRAEERLPPAEFHLRPLLRDVLIVPETKAASDLLIEFRTRRTGLAMVVDEFGSILGLATLEDILEQMVGEIHDEFDVVERPLPLPDGSMIFDAALKVRDLASRYNIVLPDDPGYETVGGFVLTRLGFIPRGGESFEAEGHRFTVMEMDRRRVSRVKIKPLQVPAAAEAHSVAPETPATSDEHAAQSSSHAHAGKPAHHKSRAKKSAHKTRRADSQTPSQPLAADSSGSAIKEESAKEGSAIPGGRKDLS
jgi:putative hemolysin